MTHATAPRTTGASSTPRRSWILWMIPLFSSAACGSCGPARRRPCTRRSPIRSCISGSRAARSPWSSRANHSEVSWRGPSLGWAPAPAVSHGTDPARTSAQRIEIAVTADGFVPTGTRIKVGQPVTLVVTGQVERTCATDIVIKDYGVNKALPQSRPVEVTFTPTKAGPIRYACAMDMVAGELVAE